MSYKKRCKLLLEQSQAATEGCQLKVIYGNNNDNALYNWLCNKIHLLKYQHPIWAAQHHLIKYIETMDQVSTALAKRLLQHLLLWIIKKSFAYNSSCSNFASGSVKQKPKTNTLCWYNRVLFAQAYQPESRNILDRYWVQFSPLSSSVWAGSPQIYLLEQREPDLPVC